MANKEEVSIDVAERKRYKTKTRRPNLPLTIQGELQLLYTAFETSHIPPYWNCKQDSCVGCGMLGNFVPHNSYRSLVFI